MTCSDAERHFLAHSRGEATPAAFGEHLAACSCCRDAYDQFVQAGALLRALPPVAARPGFADGVASRVAALPRRGGAVGSRPILAIGLAAAAVVAVVAIGVRMLPQPRQGATGTVATAPLVGPAETAMAPEPTEPTLPTTASPAPAVAAPSEDAAAPGATAPAAPADKPSRSSRSAARPPAPRGAARAGEIHDYGPPDVALAPEEMAPPAPASGGLGDAPSEPDPAAEERATDRAMGAGLAVAETPATTATESADTLAGPRPVSSAPDGAAEGGRAAAGANFGTGRPGRGGPAGPAGKAGPKGDSDPPGAVTGTLRYSDQDAYAFEFQEARVSRALAEVTRTTGVAVEIRADLRNRPPITLSLKGVTAREAFAEICRAAGLRLQDRDGAYVVRQGRAAAGGG